MGAVWSRIVELVIAVLRSVGLVQRDPRDAKFDLADLNGDGRISADEMDALYLRKTGRPAPRRAIDEFLARDTDGDVHLSRDEFLKRA